MLKYLLDLAITHFLYIINFYKLYNSSFPASGSESALVAVLCSVVTIVTGPFGQSVVILVIMTSGLGLYFGKVNWPTLGLIVVGIGFTFGAEQIVFFITKNISTNTHNYICSR